MLELDKVRSDLEDFSTEMGREWYLNLAGFKEELNQSAIYERYKHLFTKELTLSVKEKRERASGEQERKLRYLQEFFVSNYLEMAVKHLTDRAETMKSKETVTVNGERIPFRLAAVKIANGPNREVRSRLFHARNEVISDKINVVLEERMQKLHDVSRELGYENYMTLFRDVKGMDFHDLEVTMEELTSQTESIYRARMNEAFPAKVGVGLEDAEKHDIAFFFRAKEFDKFFKKERLLETLKKTLASMGIFLEEQGNIQVDTEERPKKSPRAFCVGIKVPDDVRLVLMPKGGHDDYAALLHETGHAEHFGCASRDLAVEYRRLGDNSVTESFAFLLEYSTIDENWLKQFIDTENVAEYLDFAYLHKLYFLRRYSAKLSYETKLHTLGLEGMDKTYKTTLEKALKFKHPRSHYLIDVDDGFYCAQYLRAWIFEAQLRAKLEQKFGEGWFNNPEAGRFLRGLWAKGQKYDVMELARMLGYSGLDIKPLTVQLRKRLG
jgi:oligoendopeptidase F